MRIIAYTPLGVFESKESESTEEKLAQAQRLLSRVSDLHGFVLETDNGEMYFPSRMIKRSLFNLVK
jgi:hypothetical protein